MKKLPKLPKRDLTEAERMRKFVWEDGDIEVVEEVKETFEPRTFALA